MAIVEGTAADRRSPVSRERVLRTAVDLADEGGIDAVSMRKLGQRLGVEAMALYRHVRDKDDLLDGLADIVLREIDPARPDPDWRTDLRAQVLAARAVMIRHPWAPGLLIERGTAGPAVPRSMSKPGAHG